VLAEADDEDTGEPAVASELAMLCSEDCDNVDVEAVCVEVKSAVVLVEGDEV
jgi:hypothetical protein